MRTADEAFHQYTQALRAFTEGNYRDAVRGARNLLPSLRTARDPAVVEVRLETIRLLLDASELWWSTGSSSGTEPEPAHDDLVDEARQVAVILGNQRSRAVAALLRGRHLIGSNGLGRAVAAFAEAARLAEDAGDDLLLLDALTLQGHHTVGRSITKGAALLAEAQRIAERIADRRGPDAAGPAFAHWTLRIAKLDCVRGVAEFDLGHFDTGERLLRQALVVATAADLHDQRATSTNYLCQLLIAAGRFGEAEATLTREIDLLGGYAADSPHQAYNRALLGKTRIEDARPDDAGPEIEIAWGLLEKRPHHGILTLVRNYLAELLLQPRYTGRDLGTAENLLRESIWECRRTDFQRSEVAALCLLSLVRQELGDSAAAVRHSAGAVELLEAAGGTMPALRTEEVYHRHYVALSGVGREVDAADALRKARRCILAKADSIADPGLRTTFLQRVPLNRAALTEG
ncbi:hypothetical protein JIX56_14055 [Streptomyces sp. CA-210063]|uniref:hypothetical protein n=1 Tax=Streptomyces sp. CA-210063 TaxID=2801029 RepID=UPI00214B1D66|nr:hypothetical protein [Streptomyces sp. CA-210063]UUU30940.1 hypothetical protein JIX56_14055 [Streptomyces sp. CA-210063]